MKKFIYACQDDETGGFADRPGDCVSFLNNIQKFIFVLQSNNVLATTKQLFECSFNNS